MQRKTFRVLKYLVLVLISLPQISDAQAQFTCDLGKKLDGAIVDVKGSEHELYAAPDEKSSKIVNQKATSIIGKTQYHSIDSSTQVQLQCESGDWAKVQITKPDWLTHVSGWVKRSVLAAPRAPGEARTFTEEDIYWDNLTKPYKALIVKVINRIHREDPRCKDDILVSTVNQSPSKSKPGKPVFFVTCGKDANIVNVFFTPKDVASTKPFAAPGHINQGQAINLCEAYAKQNAMHPSTVKFSRFTDLAITEHPNGRTSVQSTFTAKNSLNLELKYNIRCLLDEKGFIEANVIESQ